ncbi:MAG: hypothetical protein BroJett014_13020 [Planctomycetota bacterium]|nr:MAG: hypothetical protein BroJett014_13020 [Planctomycetota bacterium]
MPMTSEFLGYFQAMGLNPALRPRMEQVITEFETAAGNWMPGAVAESVMIIPVKDVMGNPAFELNVYGADTIMRAGVLYLKPPLELSVEFESIHKRVESVKMRGRNYDPMNPDAPVSDAAELSVEYQVRGKAKRDDIVVRGVNCRHVQGIVTRHLLANLA